MMEHIVISEPSSIFAIKPDFKENEIHISTIESNVQINFFIDSLCTLNRPVDESISKTLKRLVSNFSKKNVKKSKSKVKLSQDQHKVNNVSELPVLTYDGETLNTDKLMNSDWKSGMLLSFESTLLLVLIHAPTISSLSSFPKSKLMVGFPISPRVVVTHAEDDMTQYLWYRQQQNDDFIYISNSKHYIPKVEDIGYRLKLFCQPRRRHLDTTFLSGRSCVYYLNGTVQPYTPIFRNILDVRSSFLNNSCMQNKININKNNGMRFISYNILADAYATSEFSINQLYSYCSASHLDTEYRIQLVLKELLAYNGDVLCLQECDQRSYDHYLVPLLGEHGYGYSSYCNKEGGVNEGCAIFIKNSQKIKSVKFLNISMREYFNKSTPYLANLFSIRPDLQDLLTSKLGMIAQIGILEITETLENPPHESRLEKNHENENSFLLISNTHLFYHPSAAYVRLLQCDVILRVLSDVACYIKSKGLVGIDDFDLYSFNRKETSKEIVAPDSLMGELELNMDAINLNSNREVRVSSVFVGDLNSTTETAVIEYLEKGFISSSHEVWASINDFKWGRRMEGHPSQEEDCNISAAVQSIDVSNAIPDLVHPFKLHSAAGYPTYTNFTGSFKDVLDYIYIDEDMLTVTAVAPFPSFEELSQQVALPSEVYPSDHLAVLVDIDIKPKK